MAQIPGIKCVVSNDSCPHKSYVGRRQTQEFIAIASHDTGGQRQEAQRGVGLGFYSTD